MFRFIRIVKLAQTTFTFAANRSEKMRNAVCDICSVAFKTMRKGFPRKLIKIAGELEAETHRALFGMQLKPMFINHEL